MSDWIDRLWYGLGRPLWLLTPLTWLYHAVARYRRRASRRARQPALRAPIIVVGNITAGGTGKSPLTAWICQLLREQGWRPVILTRGYGGKARHYPMLVTPVSATEEAGDEPVMLASQAGCPVVADPRRVRGAWWALNENLGDILVCDDGLQHYALPRDVEIAVVDGDRGLGNGALIPVGPLREPPARLDEVDFVVANGAAPELDHGPAAFVMTLEPSVLCHLRTGQTRPLQWLKGRRVRAVAGIGNPGRFFRSLTALGARVRAGAMADHHRFSAEDLEVEEGEVLVMTAKDAVKCRSIAHDDCWYLEIHVKLSDGFREALLGRLTELARGSSAL